MRSFSPSPVTKKNHPARARDPRSSSDHPPTMEENHGAGRVTGIRHIVRLKEFLTKWQQATKRNTGTRSSNDNDDHTPLAPPLTQDCDEDSTPEPPVDVPQGYLAVYVGQENRRFVIPMAYLNHHLFKILLEKAEEEYGYDHAGVLTIPCETETFKYLLKCIESHPDPEGHDDGATAADGV